MKIVCNTVGELRKALENWSDNKALILDIDGNTYPVFIYEWYEEMEATDLDWPVAIDGNF